MTQYPTEKDRSDWIYPSEKSDVSRDGAPEPSSSAPAQGYGPPVGPPPSYGYGSRSAPEAVLAPPTFSPAPAPAPGPSQGESRGMSLGAFFGNRGTPPMWNRAVPQNLPYNAFPPMCLISNSRQLTKGFPDLPPPCQMNPHPFATHDVTEADWKRFLADVKNAGELSPAQRIKSNVIPLVTGMGLITGIVATLGIEKHMKNKNRGAAGDLVDHWNHYFFGPRRMEVVLCQGSERLSGRIGAAPIGDPYQQRMARKLRRRDEDSSEESSSEEEEEERGHGHGHGYGQGQPGFGQGYGPGPGYGYGPGPGYGSGPGYGYGPGMGYGQPGYGPQPGYGNYGMTSDRHARRAAKRERRAVKREKRAERRARKARGEYDLPYQLFVTAI